MTVAQGFGVHGAIALQGLFGARIKRIIDDIIDAIIDAIYEIHLVK